MLDQRPNSVWNISGVSGICAHFVFPNYARGMHILAKTFLKANCILFQRDMETHFLGKEKKTFHFVVISASHIPPTNTDRTSCKVFFIEVTSSLNKWYFNLIYNSNFNDALLVYYLTLFSSQPEITYKLPYSVGMCFHYPAWGQVTVKHCLLCEILSSFGFGAFSFSSLLPPWPLLFCLLGGFLPPPSLKM